MSANKPTKIKIVEGGKQVKVLSNVNLNYSLDLPSLKKMLSIAIRLSPQDPLYSIDEIYLNTKEHDNVFLDQPEAEKVQARFKSILLGNSPPLTDMALTVHVSRSELSFVSPNKNRPKSNRVVSTPSVNDENNATSNILSSPQPAMKKQETPGKSSLSSSLSAPLRGSILSPLSHHRSASMGSTPLRSKPLSQSTQSQRDGEKEKEGEREVAMTELVSIKKIPPSIPSAPPSSLSSEAPVRSLFTDEDESTPSSSSPNSASSATLLALLQPSEPLPPTPPVSTPSSSVSAPKAVPSNKSVSSSSPLPLPPSLGSPDLKKSGSLKVKNMKNDSKSSSSSCLLTTTPSKAKGEEEGEKTERVSTSVNNIPFSNLRKISDQKANPNPNTNSNTNTNPEKTPSKKNKKDKSSHQKEGQGVLGEEKNLSPIFSKGGRPSTGTMERQWEFMRAHFVNNEGDELEWLMISKRPGALKYARRKNDTAEDKYYRSLHEIDALESKMKKLTGSQAKIPEIINKLSELKPLTEEETQGEEAEAKAENLSQNISKLLDRLKPVMAENNPDQPWASLPTPCVDNLRLLLDITMTESQILTKSKSLSVDIAKELSTCRFSLAASRKASDEALAEMEKWSKREKDTDEYAQAMIDEEAAWFEREREANQTALAKMRTLVPVNIADLSIPELIKNVKDSDGLISLELATEIKNNKFLHWTVTHPEDIATSSFLAGERKQFFENFEGLDVTELRALAACLPDKFEIDNDGKKAEWRKRFLGRVKQIVSQENRDSVKGGWDAASNQRTMVQLAPLKPEQQRRNVYFYRTKEQFELRLSQMDEKQTMLQKKQVLLDKATQEATDSKKEYDTILAEMRDPELKALYGPDQFVKAKDLAKSEWTSAESKRKMHEKAVAQLKSSISSQPMTREQVVDSMNEMRDFAERKEMGSWSSPAQPPLIIIGVFPSNPEIKKIERQAAKFVTAEQEAEQRKKELSMMKQKPVESVEQPVASPQSEPSPSLSESLGPGRLNQLIRSRSVSNLNESETSEESSQGLETPRKLKGVLANANSDVISCLNKMFSPGGGRSQSLKIPSTPKGKIPSTPSLLSPEPQPSSTPIRDPNKKTKSKLLQKMMNPVTEFSNDCRAGLQGMMAGLGGGGGGGMSFLDQIKNKAKGKSSEEGQGEGDSGGPKGGMSFLDQIKNRGKKSPSPSEEASDSPVPHKEKGMMSFLDQIKNRNRTGSTDEPSPSPSPSPALPEKKASSSSSSSLSFLDQIKSRRIL